MGTGRGKPHSQAPPESLTLWHDGTDLLQAPVNTGIDATTPARCFFVYQDFVSATISATNPTGTYYLDHDVRWVKYFDSGVAVYGLVRAAGNVRGSSDTAVASRLSPHGRRRSLTLRRGAPYRRRRRVLVALAVSIGVSAGLIATKDPSTRFPPSGAAQTVVAVFPRPGGVVLPDASVQVVLSRHPSSSPLRAALTPPVPGAWHACGPRVECFTPSTHFLPGAHETLRVAAGAAGEDGIPRRRRPFVDHFQVAGSSVGLAQVLLAQLGYLPLQLPPASTVDVGRHPDSDPDPTPDADDPASSLRWRYPDIPATLRQRWRPGVAGVLTDGALVQFERVEGIESGTWPLYSTALTPLVWSALLSAAATDRGDPDPYAVALVHESSPERLDLWQDGSVVLRTLVNTGISGGATPSGVFYVYQRYRTQTMRGTTTTGAPYVYPNVPDVDYFWGNFAIHGFARAAYGFPQSQGCVEVPLDVAPSLYARLHYGSIVVVS